MIPTVAAFVEMWARHSRYFSPSIKGFYDEVLRELYGTDYADQAETLRELECVIRARTGHDVRCSALRGGFGCDCYKLPCPCTCRVRESRLSQTCW